MNKVFMDRVIDPKTTAKKQLNYINSLDIKQEIKLEKDPTETFYTSQIKSPIMHHVKDNYSSYQTTSGKGLSFDECMASNFGEFIEHWVFYEWIRKKHDKYIKIENLITGDEDKIESENLFKFEGRSDYIASGNTKEEAIYHALTEAFEYGLLSAHYPFFPIKNTVLDIKNFYHNIPNYITDSYAVLLRQDPRIPLYDISVFKNIENELSYMPQSIINNKGVVTITKVITHASGFIGDTPEEDPWPPCIGSRSGLSLEKTIKIAIAEQVQSHYLLKMNGYIDHDIDFSGKSNISPFFDVKNASDFQNLETETVKGDIQLIVDSFKDSGFGIWVIDITPEDCPMSVVKILTDYSIGKDNPGTMRFLKNLF